MNSENLRFLNVLGNEHDHDDENSSLTVALKIVSLVLILAMSILFGFFPFFCKRCKNSQRILGVANAFSGGIFLGIALFHLLPESGEKFEKLEEGNFMRKFPFPFFLAFLTYSLILFIEKVAFNSHALIEHDHGEHDHHDHTKALDAIPKKERSKIELDDQKENLLANEKNKGESEDSSDEEEEVIKNAISSRGKFASFMYMRNSLIDPERPPKQDRTLQRASVILTKSFHKSFHNQLNEDLNFLVNPKNVVKVNEKSVEVKKSQIEESRSSVHKESFKPKSNLTPYLLLIALSLHGFFEGIALGIQKDSQDVMFLGIAILSHKWAESFTLGVSFSKANTDKSLFIKLIVIFSIFTPVGIALGLILSNLGSDILEGIVLAMSSGTFIYVAASEVIVEEFAVTKYKFQKFFAYLLGGILVGGLSLIEKLGGHEH